MSPLASALTDVAAALAIITTLIGVAVKVTRTLTRVEIGIAAVVADLDAHIITETATAKEWRSACEERLRAVERKTWAHDRRLAVVEGGRRATGTT